MFLSHPKETCSSCLLPCRFSLCLWPPVNFLPILLHHFFCFCHILLWLLCVNVFVRVIPFHFVFTTGSLTALMVVCDRLDDISCTRAACSNGGGVSHQVTLKSSGGSNLSLLTLTVSWIIMLFGRSTSTAFPCIQRISYGTIKQYTSLGRVGLILAYVIGRSFVSSNPFAAAVMAASIGCCDQLTSTICLSWASHISSLATPKMRCNRSKDSQCCSVFSQLLCCGCWRSAINSSSKGGW